MNRPIKFRAWIKSKKVWVKHDSDRPGGLLEHVYFWNEVWNEGSDDIELMQYTGLKDKNGTEIYEGDIVRIDLPKSSYPDMTPFIVKVSWWDSLAKFGLDFPDGTSWEEAGSAVLEKTGAVIGNIYENPELLEKGGPDGE